jgi:hypothetical protein
VSAMDGANTAFSGLTKKSLAAAALRYIGRIASWMLESTTYSGNDCTHHSDSCLIANCSKLSPFLWIAFFLRSKRKYLAKGETL